MKTIFAICDSVAIQASESGDGPKRFDVVAYTGGAMRVGGYPDPVVVDLDGMTYGRSIVANLDHDTSKRVGHVTEKSKEGGKLTLAGFASAATPFREEVIASAADGFVWQASIEAAPTKLVELAAGKTAVVNGQTITGPAIIARKSVLKGFAFVSHGADDNTTATIAASAASHKDESMDKELTKWIEAMGFNPAELSDNQLAGLKANYEGRVAPKVVASGSDDLDSILATSKAKRELHKQIAKITAAAIQDNPGAIDEIEKLSQLAIRAEWSANEYELNLLRATRPQCHTVFSSPRHESITGEILEAAVCKTANLPNIDKRFDERTLAAADKHFKDGIGLNELFIITARENGHHTSTTRVDRAVMKAAFEGRPIHASGFSTLSIPGILSNIANKFLMTGFMSVDPAWREIAAIASVRDFKTKTSYTLTGSFEYEKVGPGGELKHGTVGEETYTNKADTYGKMFAITRTDIINDDLGALTAVPQRLGRGAGLKMNDVFWTEFLDNSSFFASGNNNVSTGSPASVLSLTGLTNAELKFLNQTDPNGKPLGLMPSVLLVPPTLKSTALTLMNSQQLIDGTATAAQGSSNVFAGRYRVVSSPYMENSTYTGYGAGVWYLLANPADLATIEMCFLNGREAPVVETADADFSTLGVQMRGYHDFGCNLQEPRAGVRSAGA